MGTRGYESTGLRSTQVAIALSTSSTHGQAWKARSSQSTALNRLATAQHGQLLDDMGRVEGSETQGRAEEQDYRPGNIGNGLHGDWTP